jgi:hypothetical protein
MNAVSGEVLLGNKAADPSVDEEASGVKDHAPIHHRQTDGDDHPTRQRSDSTQQFQGRLQDPRAVKGIFTAITSEAKLRQAQDRRLLFPGKFDRTLDVLEIGLPSERSLIQGCRGNAEQFHAKS